MSLNASNPRSHVYSLLLQLLEKHIYVWQLVLFIGKNLYC